MKMSQQLAICDGADVDVNDKTNKFLGVNMRTRKTKGGIGTAQDTLQPPDDQNRELHDCKDQGLYQDVQYEVPEILISPFPVTTTSTPKRKASVLLSPMESIDFDTLFEDPSMITCGIRESFDDGVFPSDIENNFIETEGDRSTCQKQLSKHSNIFRLESRLRNEHLPEADMPTKARLSRVDRIMGKSLAQILVESYENSRNLLGFRHKVAHKINHKYCSYYRCDDMIFVFLYIVFGIAYICAGAIGIGQCSSEKFVNLFLIIDGIFSVFVFPITIVEWTKRIGGCVKLDENSGHGVTFATILILRIAAAITGTVVLVLRVNHFPRDDLICWAVLSLLKVGVVLEWTFMLFAILLPLLLYTGAYIVARKL